MKIRRLLMDIEANGLLEPTDETPAVDTVWSLVIRDQDTKQIILSCANTGLPDNGGYPTIEHGLRWLMDQDPSTTLVVLHNGIDYDYPVLRKIYPWFKLKNIRARLMDTLVIAGMLWAHMYEVDGALVAKDKLPADLRGSHKLKAWGYRLGCHKGEYTGGWAKWSPEMQRYCEQDTLTLWALSDHIAWRVQRQNAEDNRPIPGEAPTDITAESIETELELAWYLMRQEHNGWPFNLEKAHKLYASLSSKREALTQELKKVIKPWLKPAKYKGDFVVKVPSKDRVERARSRCPQDPRDPNSPMVPLHYMAGAPYSVLELMEFNPSSRQQIANRLMTLWGWQPTSFTKSGLPEVDEDSLDALAHIPEVKLIQDYLLIDKRISQLAEGKTAWLVKARKHPFTNKFHIFGRVKQSGTVTHRASHVDPNVAQVPKVGKPYGAECRELFEVPDCPLCGASDCPECPEYENHWVQIGADQSGLELRMLSHYMGRWDGGKYGKTVTEGKQKDGTDVHSVNRDALGLSGKEGRDDAKTFIYAFLYGAGDLKIGITIRPTDAMVAEYKQDKVRWARAREALRKRKQPSDDRTVAAFIHGGVLRAKFIKGVPALGNLSDCVKAMAKQYGYLLLIDRRRVYIRHAHAALNSLLQGSGAVVCKRWIVILNRKLEKEFGKQGWQYLWAAMGWIHDEVQIAARRKIANRVVEILVESAREVGEHFNLRTPTAGEASIGQNWMETH